jgi:hypothetical protein
MIVLQFTIEDEGVFTTPWTATMTYVRDPDGWPEMVCAENIQWYSRVWTVGNLNWADRVLP